MGTLHDDASTCMIISRSDFLTIRNITDKFVEKIGTHILCSKLILYYRAVYEVMGKNFVQPDRPQTTI